MKHLATFILVFASLLPGYANACREPTKYPEHIEASDPQVRATYYVVEITERDGAGFSGRIRRAFGGPLPVGARVRVRFTPGEDAHAVCRMPIHTGTTYLLKTTEPGHDVVISAYNWLNVPEGHPRFNVYVNDLASDATSSDG
jgi:hypothetical protein